MLRAVEQPLREIVANAGIDSAVVLNRVMENPGNYGYNAQTGEYGDMMKTGVIDPIKMVRVALQNATSVAGLMITTEAMVSEPPRSGALGGGGEEMGIIVVTLLQVVKCCIHHQRQPEQPMTMRLPPEMLKHGFTEEDVD